MGIRFEFVEFNVAEVVVETGETKCLSVSQGGADIEYAETGVADMSVTSRDTETNTSTPPPTGTTGDNQGDRDRDGDVEMLDVENMPPEVLSHFKIMFGF